MELRSAWPTSLPSGTGERSRIESGAISGILACRAARPTATASTSGGKPVPAISLFADRVQTSVSMQPFLSKIETGRPPDGPAPAWMRYGLALLAFGAALLARFLLTPFLPPTGFPFLTFFPAIILATLF